MMIVIWLTGAKRRGWMGCWGLLGVAGGCWDDYF